MCRTLPLVASGSSAMACSVCCVGGQMDVINLRFTALGIAQHLLTSVRKLLKIKRSDRRFRLTLRKYSLIISMYSQECGMANTTRFEEAAALHPRESISDLKWPADPAEIP